jgi:hypothetical protein
VTECSQSSFEFSGHFSRQVAAGFDGGTIASDGGALPLREVDRRIKLLGRLANCFTDRRPPELVEHGVAEMASQRVYGLALGYEDRNDHDQSRGNALAGKSTLSRLEQAAAQPDRRRKI